MVDMKSMVNIILVVGLTVASVRAQTTPSNAPGYPNLQDVPSRQEKPAMTGDDITKLKQDLSATRDRHQPPAARAEPKTANGTALKIIRGH